MTMRYYCVGTLDVRRRCGTKVLNRRLGRLVVEARLAMRDSTTQCLLPCCTLAGMCIGLLTHWKLYILLDAVEKPAADS